MCGQSALPCEALKRPAVEIQKKMNMKSSAPFPLTYGMLTPDAPPSSPAPSWHHVPADTHINSCSFSKSISTTASTTDITTHTHTCQKDTEGRTHGKCIRSLLLVWWWPCREPLPSSASRREATPCCNRGGRDSQNCYTVQLMWSPTAWGGGGGEETVVVEAMRTVGGGRSIILAFDKMPRGPLHIMSVYHAVHPRGHPR